MSGSESKWKTAVRVLIQLVLVVIVLLIAALAFKKMLSMRKPPEKKAAQVSAPLLNAQTVYPGDMQMEIGGFGTVGSKIEVKVVPQVSGVVIDCHDNLVDGGFFKADEWLIVIEQADYELAVESAAAVVARAQVRLDQELAEATVARQEWDQLHPGTEPTSPLVLRRPQISQAKAELKAAEAQLAKAQLNLKRTVISMPFAGRVQAESVDIGQYLMSGQAVATVYGTDVVEIVVPLEDRDLQWFSIPESNSGPSGRSSGHNSTEAVVAASFAGAEHSWEGKVIRTQGRIDPSSRMVNVVVEVPEPFKLSNGRPALVPGMFVEVTIKGRKLKDIIAVPRYAVHNGDEVWVAREDRLNIQRVEIIRNDKEHAYVASGLSSGDIVITSPLDTVTDRMKIQVNVTNPESDLEDRSVERSQR